MKNHLDASPEGQREPKSQEKKKKPKTLQQKELELRHGPLTAEKLKIDYQVQRALEILVSFEVFKKLIG